MDILVLDRKEKLISVLTNEVDEKSNLYGAILNESLEGVDTLEIEVPVSSDSITYLKEENYLLFKKLDNTWSLFVIKNVDEEHATEHSINITAEQSAQELIDYECSYEMYNVDTQPKDFLDKLLVGTRWQVGEVEDVVVRRLCEVRTLGGSVLAAIHAILSTFDMEVRYRITVEGNKITGRYVDIKHMVGEDINKRIEYTKNLESIKRSVSTLELKTAMIGEGGPEPKPEPPVPPTPENPNPPVVSPPKPKEYLNLKPHMATWRVYKTTVPPVVGNQCGFLAPQRYGGLSYTIKSKPQADIYSIQTAELGYVNIYAPRDNDSTITSSPAYGNNNPGYRLMPIEEEVEEELPPIDLIDFEWTSKDGMCSTKKGQNFVEVKKATEHWGYLMPDGNLQARVGWYVNRDITDRTILAEETYKYLQEFLYPRVAYEIGATDLYALTGDEDYKKEHIVIGDTIVVVDREFSTPLALKTRVITKVTDLLAPENTSFVLGDRFMDTTNNNDKVNGGDIQNLGDNKELGSIGNSIIKAAKIYVDEVNADKVNVGELNAIVGNIETLISEKATIKDLEAQTIITDKLTVNIASIGEAVIGKADITDLNATNIKVDKLVGLSGEFEELKVNYGEFEKLVTGKLEATDGIITNLKTDVADIGTAVIGKADIGTVTAIDGKIDQLASKVVVTEKLETELARIDEAIIKKATITDLNATNIKVDNIIIKVADIDKAVIKKAEITDLNATNVKVDKLVGLDAEFETMRVEFLDVKKVVADKINANEVNALIGNFDKILAGTITSNELNAAVGRFKKIEVETAKIGTLVADVGNIKDLTAGNITAENIEVGSITGDRIVGKSITANEIKAGTITAESGILANGAIGTATITDGAISSVKIGKGQINSAHINSATILDAFIQNLNASKITTGILDCARLTVVNLKAESITTGSITIQGENLLHDTDFKQKGKWTDGGVIDSTRKYQNCNSLKIENVVSSYSEYVRATKGEVYVITLRSYCIASTKPTPDTLIVFEEYENTGSRISYQESEVSSTVDTWNLYNKSWSVTNALTTRVRIRILSRAEGITWIAQPMLSKGSIASMWKLHTDELISDGAINNDKLGDGSVTASKLVLDELFSDSAFIKKLSAIEISAKQITTDVISNERIDIKGLIKFESLSEDLQDKFIYDSTSNTTMIDGGKLYANSVTAEKVNVKGLVVSDKVGETTFSIDKEGEVRVTGNIESINFDERGELGYRLEKSGDIILNNAIVRGDVLLPNAGITNFGALQGNENLCLDSHYKTFADFTNIANQSVMVSTIRFKNKPKEGDTFIVSYIFEYENLVRKDANSNIWLQGAGNVSGWSGSFYGGERLKDKIDWTAKTGAFKISYMWTANKDTAKDDSISINFRNDYIVSGKISCKQMKVEMGSEETPWSPAPTDIIDNVRIWAGADFENRKNAPFKVYQDGTIEATKGKFGGTFTGKLEIGNILIEDTDKTNARLEVRTNTNETMIGFTDTEATYKVPTTFYKGSKEILKIDTANNITTFSDGKILATGTNVKVKVDTTSAKFLSMEYIGGTYGNYSHSVAFAGGGLHFSNLGALGTNDYDYKFSRSGGNVKFGIEGELDVKEVINIGVMKIVRRNETNNEGVDFII